MDKDDLPSDSDASDEDYNPDGADSDLPSEVESDGEPEEILNDETRKGQKRSKVSKKAAKKIKVNSAEVINEQKELTDEERKRHEESLWADFLGSTDTKPKQTLETKILPKNETVNIPNKPKVEKVSITQIFNFAGEEVKVTKEVSSNSAEARLSVNAETSGVKNNFPSKLSSGSGRVGGVASVLSQLGKKSKISTLEKSKLDWDSFKKDEGIEDEIQTHNKGKDGYLERQDFLQRTDLRQFEIEKQLRAKKRSNR